jgi:CRP-like cAMP-binding protein
VLGGTGELLESKEQQALSRFLAKLLLRSPLDEEQQREILSLEGRLSRYSAHRDIVSPGERVQESCLVADGLVGRFDQMASGQRQITAFHIAGDMSDLHSVVVPTAAWSITALSNCTVMLIPHAQLQRLIDRHEAIAMAFWRESAVDGSRLAKWIGNMGRKNALSRLAHLFCEMGVAIETAGLGTRLIYDLPATQEQIADAVGLTSVHTNRVLQELRGENLLIFRSGRVEILDWARLAALAEFDPNYLVLRRPNESVNARLA